MIPSYRDKVNRTKQAPPCQNGHRTHSKWGLRTNISAAACHGRESMVVCCCWQPAANSLTQRQP